MQDISGSDVSYIHFLLESIRFFFNIFPANHFGRTVQWKGSADCPFRYNDRGWIRFRSIEIAQFLQKMVGSDKDHDAAIPEDVYYPVCRCRRIDRDVASTRFEDPHYADDGLERLTEHDTDPIPCPYSVPYKHLGELIAFPFKIKIADGLLPVNHRLFFRRPGRCIFQQLVQEEDIHVEFPIFLDA